MRQQIDLVSWLLLLLLATLWSTSFVFNEIALVELDPFTVAFGRVATGALAIWLFVLIGGFRVPRSLRVWRSFAILGLLNNAVPFSLILWGQGRIQGGEAAILNATTPIFAVLIGHFMTADDRLSVNRVVGICIGLGGVTLLVGIETFAFGPQTAWGYLAIIGASVTYGFAAQAARRLMGAIPGPVLAAGMLTMSSLWMIPVVAWLGAPLSASVSAPTVLSVLALGILCSAVAYIVYFAILRRAGATNLMLVTMIIPPGTLLLGAVFLDERFGSNDFAGLALIIAALVVIDGRILQHRRLRSLRPTR